MRKKITAKPKKPPTLPLGATDTRTGYLLFPNVAEKRGEYACPECRHRVLLCRGEKVMAYFRHEISNEAKAECKHYSHPSESTIHRNAKEQLSQVLADVLRKGTPLTIYRECDKCNKMEDVQEITMAPTTTIHQEYVFTFRGDKKRGDVVCMDGLNMRYVFEIWNSNRTQEGDRPEPWFDLYADRILMKVAEHALTKEPLRLPCNRKHLCKACDNEGRVGLRWMNLEMYVRIKLGQTYPAPGIDQYGRLAHARLAFDAQDDVAENREIIERFTADYEGFPVVVHSCKGILYGYIILDDGNVSRLFGSQKSSHDDYWNYAIMETDSSDMICYVANLTGYGTVSAIMELIRRCSSDDLKEKAEKIKAEIKQKELEQKRAREKEERREKEEEEKREQERKQQEERKREQEKKQQEERKREELQKRIQEYERTYEKERQEEQERIQRYVQKQQQEKEVKVLKERKQKALEELLQKQTEKDNRKRREEYEAFWKSQEPLRQLRSQQLQVVAKQTTITTSTATKTPHDDVRCQACTKMAGTAKCLRCIFKK